MRLKTLILLGAICLVAGALTTPSEAKPKAKAVNAEMMRICKEVDNGQSHVDADGYEHCCGTWTFGSDKGKSYCVVCSPMLSVGYRVCQYVDGRTGGLRPRIPKGATIQPGGAAVQ